MKEFILKKLGEQGLSFLIMGIIVYQLWSRQVTYEKKMEDDLKSFKQENKECQSTYKELLKEQVSVTTRIIEENTNVLKQIKDKQ